MPNTKTGEIQAYEEKLNLIPAAENEAAEDFFESIFMRVFDAASLEDSMKASSSYGLQELEGKTIKVIEALRRPSAMGSADFLVLAVEVDGKPQVVTTGAAQPCAVVARAYSENKLPFDAKVKVQASAANPSRRSIWLEHPDAF